jgi:four helix bundle protein
MANSKSILKTKSFAFAVRVTKLYRYLVGKNEFVLSKQLLRSGTAVGALIREAKNAESINDFIHKLGIAQKECDETLYCLNYFMKQKFLLKNSLLVLLQMPKNF